MAENIKKTSEDISAGGNGSVASDGISDISKGSISECNLRLPSDQKEVKITQAAISFQKFVDVIAVLRGENGCPWDKEQTHESIARNMIEEAYEAADAIEFGETDFIVEELGDVLLQVVLHAQIGKDEGEFNIVDVIDGITEKIIRRHPHVFGNEASFKAAHLSEEEIDEIKSASSPDDVKYLWDYIKVREKKQKNEKRISAAKARGEEAVSRSILDDVPKAQSALMQAQDISRKAVSYGFEWESVDEVWGKVDEEISEYKQALVSGDKKSAQTEFGDVLFTLVNVARKDGIDCESALMASCNKFRKRWAKMEDFALKDDLDLSVCGVQKLEEYWQRAKIFD